MKLSAVLATRNEEENIGRCLKSLKSIADEIIVFDEYSTDNTKKIAEELGAKVYLEPHHDIFHITKQKAIDMAKGEWVLQMDADEVITPELADEISEVVNMTNEEILKRKPKSEKLESLFERHQKLIEERDGKIDKDTNEVVAFFIPRRNMFLGKPLIHAGVYPDPAIRLIKKGKAWLPAKSVHEIMKIDGKIAWLYNDMEHYDSPTLKRYLMRLNRYTDLHADELKTKKVSKGLIGFVDYVFIKPTFTFLNLYIRHKGFLDGLNGFLWSFFSALHFPIAYFKYVTSGLK
ncbi:MAG: glycosyltransferase family 2 protein [Microgenomates group bacterium]